MASGVGEPWCVAAARLRQPNVAQRGEDSGKDTGGGRDDKTTRGRGKQSCRRSGVAGGRWHARAAEEQGSSGTRGGRQGTQLRKVENSGALL
jgi:hypothetical protein